MHTKCIKESGSGKAEKADLCSFVREVFPIFQHYYSITENKDKVCA